MLTVGVLRERGPGERRVALVPDTVGRLAAAGLELLVETGAGAAAFFSDRAYQEAGAGVTGPAEVLTGCDVLACVGPPEESVIDALYPGQLLVGLLAARQHPALVRRCATAGVTMLSLDLLPRTLSRAQTMDALSSQATVAGYKAALVAADAYGGFFPMLMTAAGTSRPAQVLVLGAAVAGLQAIGTARRLGAIVTGYDVRPAAQTDIRSLGARFLELPGTVSDSGQGGYARALDEREQQAQQQALAARIGGFDVVITTAQVPGRVPPVLVTAEALAGMRPGSVVVDLAAGPLGGNVAGSVPDRSTVLAGGVTVIGAGNLPAAMPAAASTAYARNLTALLGHLVRDGALQLDPTDEIQAALLVTRGGRIVNPAFADVATDAPGEGASAEPVSVRPVSVKPVSAHVTTGALEVGGEWVSADVAADTQECGAQLAGAKPVGGRPARGDVATEVRPVSVQPVNAQRVTAGGAR